jgi:hypothetical protein
MDVTKVTADGMKLDSLKFKCGFEKLMTHLRTAMVTVVVRHKYFAEVLLKRVRVARATFLK